MSVYVDAAKNAHRGMLMSHMIADTEAELHSLADKIGLLPRWYQANASTPHYDVSQSKRAMAVALGAVELDRREYVAVIQRLRAERKARKKP